MKWVPSGGTHRYDHSVDPALLGLEALILEVIVDCDRSPNPWSGLQIVVIGVICIGVSSTLKLLRRIENLVLKIIEYGSG